MYENKVPTSIITKEFGLSRTSVSRILRKYGIERRGVGRIPSPKKPKRETVPELPNSIWKPILGYEGLYEVSDKGQVRSVDRVNHLGSKHKGRILRERTIPNGYVAVALTKEGKQTQYSIHRLVAIAFYGEPTDKDMQVNHKDGNKKNNVASNLEWVTRVENMRHAHDTGLMPRGKGSRGART